MKYEVTKPLRQVAMVLDLNKCLGCHTCSVACKKLWNTDTGTDYSYWNNVETLPGKANILTIPSFKIHYLHICIDT